MFFLLSCLSVSNNNSNTSLKRNHKNVWIVGLPSALFKFSSVYVMTGSVNWFAVLVNITNHRLSHMRLSDFRPLTVVSKLTLSLRLRLQFCSEDVSGTKVGSMFQSTENIPQIRFSRTTILMYKHFVCVFYCCHRFECSIFFTSLNNF